MLLSTADLSTLSRLLDEAMDVPADGFEPWLRTLAAVDAPLIPHLRLMFAGRASAPGCLTLGPRADLACLAGDATVAKPGDVIGAYRLIRPIGEGGMGSVWLAEGTGGGLKRKVALKLPRLMWGSNLSERMARERDIGALLEHPHIARLYDAGVDARGRPFLALEHIEGVPLDAWCRDQQLPVRERLRLFLQVARAVAYAHGRLVVHRDLKPSNVLVTADGQAHLLDFGIAKLLDEQAANSDLTQNQGAALTPQYASPEQLEGKTITVTSDVYSLGVLLFELLTGKRPYNAKRNSAGALEEAILAADPPLASARVDDRATARALRGELDAIVSKALRRRPEDRYATADAFADDIERFLRGEPVLARRSSAVYRLGKLLRRHWVGVMATACVAIAIVGGSIATTIQAHRAVRAAERERIVREFVSALFHADSAASAAPAGIASQTGRLEGSAELIETRFEDQPETRADLYGLVADVFVDMGANALAADYSRRQLQSLDRAGGREPEHDTATLRLAQALFHDERYGEAEQRLRPLVARQQAAGSNALEATVLLARVLLETGDVAGLDATLARIDARVAESGAVPSAALAWSQAIRAERNARVDMAASGALFEAAIRSALEAEGLHSMTAVEIRLRAAATLWAQENADNSEPFLHAAVAELASRGGAFANRASLEQARYRWRRARQGKGDREVALAAIEQCRAELLASAVATPRYIFVQLDYWFAELKSNWGDLSALPLMERAAPVLRGIYPPAGRLRLATDMGDALADAGRHREADVWLREALQLAQGLDGRDRYDVLHAYVDIANNQRMAGDLGAALATLDAAEKSLALTGDPRLAGLARDGLAAARAAVFVAKGDAAVALTILRPHVHEGRQSDDPWRQAMDRLYIGEPLGEALCATQSTKAGQRRLELAIGQIEKVGAEPYAPELARIHAHAGACALGNGDFAQARRDADFARAAFARQPGVSEYYKAPLADLEAKLAAQR